MRLVTDGAELAQNSVLSAATGLIIDNTLWRSGLASYRGKNVTSYWTWPAALAEYYCRIGVRTDLGGDVSLISFFGTSDGNIQVEVFATAAGLLQLKIGGTVRATYAGVLANTWYLLEVYHKSNTSTGVVTVRLDGTQVMTWTGNTRPAAFDIGRARLLAPYAAYVWWDDLALNDTSGGVDDSWPGEGHVVCLVPNGNGHVNSWAGSDGNSVDNYLLVDDVPSDEDTTYVESGTSAARDFYSLPMPPDVEGGLTIRRVWLEARARDTAAEGPQVNLGLYKGSSYNWSAALSLLTTYTAIRGAAMTTNPFTSLPWQRADFSGMELGQEVV